jgi:hypothetical protein
MRRIWAISVVWFAFLAILGTGTGIAGPHGRPAASFKCPKGFKKVRKAVSRHGKKKVVFHCRKLPVAQPAPIVLTPPAPSPPTPTPAAPTPARPASVTSLGAAYEALPPEKVGIIEFKVGQYQLAGAVAPFGVPSLVCGALAGCVEPAGSLAASILTVPVLARLERAKNLDAIWSLGVTPPVGKPSWISLPELAAGSRFFQATGAPEPSIYEPSTARVPIQLIEPHLPGTSRHENESNGPVGETLQSIIFFNGPSYKKLGGTSYDLIVEGNETVSATSAEGCKFQVRMSGIPPTSGKEWTDGYNESVFTNVLPNSLHPEIWARHEGGEANCGLKAGDTYVIYERPHS